MKTVSDLARALEKGVQASWGLGEQPEEPGAPSSAVGAHLRGGKDGVLVEAEHGICDDVVVGQKTAAHHLGGRRKKAGGKKLGKRATFSVLFSGQFPHPQPSERMFHHHVTPQHRRLPFLISADSSVPQFWAPTVSTRLASQREYKVKKIHSPSCGTS